MAFIKKNQKQLRQITARNQEIVRVFPSISRKTITVMFIIIILCVSYMVSSPDKVLKGVNNE